MITIVNTYKYALSTLTLLSRHIRIHRWRRNASLQRTTKYFCHQSHGLFAQFTVYGGETGEGVVVIHIFFFFFHTEQITMFPHGKTYLEQTVLTE